MDEWRMDVWMVCYYNTMARQHYHVVVVDIFSCCRESMEWGKHLQKNSAEKYVQFERNVGKKMQKIAAVGCLVGWRAGDVDAIAPMLVLVLAGAAAVATTSTTCW